MAPGAAPPAPPPRRRDVPNELRRGVALLLPAELPLSGRLDPEDEHEGRLITRAYSHDAASTAMLYDVRARGLRRPKSSAASNSPNVR